MDGSIEAVEAALQETESFTQSCGLAEKKTLQLRLLAEELFSMTNGLIDMVEGTFFAECEDNTYRLFLSAKAEIGKTARSQLLKVSTTPDANAPKGISGKIRQALQWLLQPSPAASVMPVGMYGSFSMDTYTIAASDEAVQWSLKHYIHSVEQEEKAQAWDELEKSVLGKLADDVNVAVKMNRVEITIVKSFN